MTWLLTWLNMSVVTLNATLQLLVIYRLVCVMARLRPYLDKLISPMQTAFVPGCKGIDNVIIA